MSKTCILCGREYDDSAKSCPYCQQNIKSTKKKGKLRLNLNFNFSINSRPKGLIVFAILFLLIVAMVVSVLIFIPTRKSFGGSEEFPAAVPLSKNEYVCPDFRGMTIDDVENHEFYKDNILDFEFQYEYNEEYPKGQVCGQSLEHERKIKKGADITLYVSQGQETLVVPDVCYWAETDAVNELLSRGFKRWYVQKIENEEVEAGMVVRTEPAAGTEISQDDSITVYVSSGKAPKYVSVPNLIGYNYNEAINILSSNNLSYSLNFIDSSVYPKDIVCNQSPMGSDNVLEGTEIILYISNTDK